MSLIGLAGISLLYPILESLDPWDSPEPSSDAEIQLIVLFTFVGIMFVLAHVLATLSVVFGLMRALQSLRKPASARLKTKDVAFLPLLTASPPVPLRI